MQILHSYRSLARVSGVDRGRLVRLAARQVIRPAAMLSVGTVGRPPIMLFGTAAVEAVRALVSTPATQPVKLT